MFSLDSQFYPLVFAVLTGALVIYVFSTTRPNGSLHPPGPKGIPIFGNLFQLSMTAWNEFEKWKTTYGPVVYITVAGQGMLILNSHTAAADLLERRGAVYGDRPRWIVGGEILTGGLFLALIKQGNIFLKFRRAGHDSLNKFAAATYKPVHLREAVIMTKNLLNEPNAWKQEFRRLSGSTILSVVYGLPSTMSSEDPLVLKINDFADRLLHAMFPGNHLVEFFPWMMHLPSAVAGWKRRAEEGFVSFSALFEGLFQDVEKRIGEGDNTPSLSADLVRRSGQHGLNNTEASWLGATMYTAGSESASAILAWFFLAMIAYPDKQKRCQEELDAVVGRSRMPTFEDAEKLPYVMATIREALRWRPVAPLGVHHYTTEDDWYQGYLIPKGTICLANIWSINRDIDVYGPDADDFNPGRFIDENGKLSPAAADTNDDGHVSFGYGPRICMGRHLVNDSLFISIASILWAFEISPIVDETTGKPTVPDTTFRPLPFDCTIEPRFSEVDAVVTQTKAM